MKATIEGETQKEQEWKFPCLGVSDGLVVMFYSETNGVVVVSGLYGVLGEYSNEWQILSFKPLPSSQKVILQND
jgi:hypothetical protein